MHSARPPDERRSFIEQARHAQIIQATIEVLAEQGYGAASFARIARRASISPALISYHFDNKDLLMRAVLATAEERLDTAMAGTDDDEPVSYPDALNGMLVRFVERCWTHGAEISAMTEIRQQVRTEALREVVAASHERGVSELVAFIEEGRSQGQFRDADPVLFAEVLMAAMGEVPRLRGSTPEQNRGIALDWASFFVNAIALPTGPGEDSDDPDPGDDTLRSDVSTRRDRRSTEE